ncbi:cyclic GMP-AMP synthase DncV-like nucleotidyltransferase [Gordonia sp. ABKF26]|uniref:SMODS domain-containing nucleotidyltransferase n=1 Tax=Gordonia sp. ABKF26 TaxID=3238687 RepID=UPI0034E49001
MKHVDAFDSFLRNTVNLSKGRLGLLEARVDAVYAALTADDDLGRLINRKVPQGSWPQKTIINPQNGKAFDGDFMVEMEENPEWGTDLKRYGDAVYRVLHNTSPYSTMPHGRKCRCVYLEYAENAMHIDIVPSVRRSDGTQWIINRDNNTWERTDPEAFTAWMQGQDEIANKHLREVIRVMKYLRDHRNSFTGTRSILLTTLLGERVEGWRTITDPGYYADLPTALLNIVSDLDDWLQFRPSRPPIMDPAQTGTSFDHRWSNATYEYFRDRIHAHAAQIRDAYHETDRDESLRKWQALFGTRFRLPAGEESPARYAPVTTGSEGGATPSVSHSGRAG